MTAGPSSAMQSSVLVLNRLYMAIQVMSVRRAFCLLFKDLAEVIGSKPVPRTEVVKKLWAYIRKNNLQDPKERRMINADDKLRVVFGGKKQVSMFEMTKLVSKHLS